jgi:GDPmannose 4,6-dehydratase
MKTALITGVTGQDGSYLAEFLLEKGYKVCGIIRRSSSFNRDRVEHLSHFYKDPHSGVLKMDMQYGDLSDSSSLRHILEKIKPDEIYNLGAQSHVKISFEIPEYTADVDALGVLRMLDAMKDICPKSKFYQASSSEMFGKAHEIPLKETSPFYPRSPYGCAKVFGYWITKNYRESYGLHASNGILFNHESPRRGENFVTRKITRGLARVKLGKDEKLFLGNLEAKRDWGYAKDYVEGMWLMLQQDEPDDYVLATNESHTIREFVEKAASFLDFNMVWKGEGLNEKGIDTKTGKTIVEISESYFRPAEVDVLQGDYSKAKNKIGWEPKVRFSELAEIMVKADLDLESKNK